MTSVGTGYDLSNSVFSPDGRNFQVEYASKAVENGSTTVGLKCKDGVVFGVEKIITNKLLVPGKNRKIQTIERHIGCCYSGLIPDGKHLVNRGREEAINFKNTYGKPISVSAMSERLSQYVQAYTLYNSVRPFGISTIFGGVLKNENGGNDKPELFMLDPNGSCWGYKGIATGKGRQTAKAELEKLITSEIYDLSAFTARQAVQEVARILYLAHEDNKDKDFELELSWCSLSETDGLHKFVPKDIYEEAIEHAKIEVGLADSDDSDEDEDMEPEAEE
ncbi:A gated channel into the proteasome core particle [Hanseniaspora valbyensis NRRL Y-1626]|uniref:A gated channel into the proteasome core particle n=1 Tax=Hanseniaspora valbyensis NRRL Y-1626 TaxID=766949 RepID=A0A1B7T994_9ASCO|nr:A gated channel into the proteasome core particle [Hanseniaspora valbyensis NRRL Y-1626]